MRSVNTVTDNIVSIDDVVSRTLPPQTQQKLVVEYDRDLPELHAELCPECTNECPCQTVKVFSLLGYSNLVDDCQLERSCRAKTWPAGPLAFVLFHLRS